MTEERLWQDDVYAALKAAGVAILSYVPDAGHSRTIRRALEDPDMESIVLTTEEEGVALTYGAWLGGKRSVLLMQSSGVGNCINMLGMVQSCAFPFLTLVTMRGEWEEFNPWQVPMSQATQPTLEAMAIEVRRAEDPATVGDMVRQAADDAFEGERGVALLFGQKMIGKKVW